MEALLKDLETAVGADGVATATGEAAAEHGIGLQKREFLGVSRSPVELAVMRTFKDALDRLGQVFCQGRIDLLAA